MALLYTMSRFSSHFMGSKYWTWLTKPQHVFHSWHTLFSKFSCTMKYIPYSDKIRIFLPGFDPEMQLERANISWSCCLWDNEARILDHADPGVVRVQRVFEKIIRALSDGLRLERDCRVIANYNVPNREYPEKHNGVVVPSRFGSKGIVSRGFFGSPIRFLGMKHDTEHLEGLTWEVTVVQSNVVNAMYYGNGKIVLLNKLLESTCSDEDIASLLAHEVGHGVAMHLEGDPRKALWFFPMIPLSLVYWDPAIFIRLYQLVLACHRREEHEADYIGLMLMASAGYDPRVVPHFLKKYETDEISLGTTHPSERQRSQMLSREHVMGRAIKIYEQVRAGHGVPSFI